MGKKIIDGNMVEMENNNNKGDDDNGDDDDNDKQRTANRTLH